jgi:Protein of unknown function (DUF2934)
MDHLSDIQNERSGPMDQAMTLRIRERAYHIWSAHGGYADKNWLQAETEILQSLRPQAPKQKGRGVRNRKSAAAAKVS